MREIVNYRVTAVFGLYGDVLVKDGKILECYSLWETREMRWIKHESNVKVGDQKDRLGACGYGFWRENR